MKEIVSINNEYIKYLYKLKDKKTRYAEKKFLVEGFHLVEEAYKANILEEVLFVNESLICENVNQIKTNQKVIEKLSSTKSPQEIIGVCKMKDNFEIKGSKILLILSALF